MITIEYNCHKRIPSLSTFLDINSWTYAKYGKKVLFRERAKRSASSYRDNKRFFVLGLGTGFLLALLLVSSLKVYELYIP